MLIVKANNSMNSRSGLAWRRARTASVHPTANAEMINATVAISWALTGNAHQRQNHIENPAP